MKRTRLARVVQHEHIGRGKRLGMLAKKRETVKDIMSLAGSDELYLLEDELCGYGDDLEEQLMTLTPVQLNRVRDRILGVEKKEEAAMQPVQQVV